MKLFLGQKSKFVRSLIAYPKFPFSVIGIDIGGSNTCMAILEPSGPRVIENAEGTRTTPSFVSFQDANSMLVAVNAKKVAIQNINSSFYGIRHFLTNNNESITGLIDKKRFPFKVTTDKADTKHIMLHNGFDKSYTPIEASSYFLKYCKEQADALLGKNIRKVVVSIPETLNNSISKDDIRETLGLVGMTPIHFIDESKSVVLAYNSIDKSNLVVFNLGGTSFSITHLIKKKSDETTEGDSLQISKAIELFEVNKSFRNDFIGGDEIDDAITNHFVEEFGKKNRIDITKEPSAMQRIREAAEKAKIELSLSNQVEINLPFLMADKTGPKHLQMSLSRPKFERIIDSVTSKIKKDCLEFKQSCGSSIDNIEDILLSGGVSRIPLIQDVIKSVFKKEPNKSVNPEEAGAIGACIIADSFNVATEEKLSFDTLPLSFGIESLGGEFTILFEKDCILPGSKTFKIKTVYDNQPTINLKFYMGERAMCEDNRLIGDVKMNVPLAKRGETQIEVNVKIDSNGFLQVKLIELIGKKSVSYTIDLSNGLTPEIVEDVLSISAKFKEVDEYSMSNIKLKREIDQFIYSIDGELSKIRSVTDPNSEIINKLDDSKAIISELEQMVNDKSDNRDIIVTKYNELKDNLEMILSKGQEVKH